MSGARGRRFRILALDGGGIRGVLPAMLLERLEQELPGFLGGTFLFAGTSISGVVALGLAAGLPPSRLHELVRRHAREIFDSTWTRNLHDLAELPGAAYDSRGYGKLLEELFGKRRLAQLERRVLVAAFELDSRDPDPWRRQWKPKFFHNFPGEDSDGTSRVVHVALATSATPTYFPASEGFLDGSIVASNPSLAALVQAIDRRNAAAERARIDEVCLLSVGAAAPLQYISRKSPDWGPAQWARPLLRAVTEGSVSIPDHQCRCLLGQRYHRLDPSFPPGTIVVWDDVKRMAELITRARRQDLSDTVRWLRAHWMQ